MVKFVHTGDIHLGLQFKNIALPKDKSINRRLELWQTFSRLMEYVVSNNVDFLLIAGDLFEKSYFNMSDIRKLRDMFKLAENVNILISAGNHDYIDRESLYEKIQWSENVTIFKGNRIDTKEFPNKNTVIYGYSWDSIEIKEDTLTKSIENIDPNQNNILIIHGDISKNSNYLPLDLNYLKSLNMDYIALGHIHKPEFLDENIAYCGSLEPLDFGETGYRGFVEGTIENKKLYARFTSFSSRRFFEVKINVNENMGYPEILNKISAIDNGHKSKDFYRVYIDGFKNKNVKLDTLNFDLENTFYYIEIIDNTILDYDLEKIQMENENNIIGKFIEEMKVKSLEDPIVRDALYIGLEALSKGEL